jgi:hypothetical protein
VQQSCGTGADLAVLDRNPEALRRLDAVLGNRVRTLFSNTRRGGASLPAGRSRHRERSRAGLNHAEIDHGANGEGGENRRDGELP